MATTYGERKDAITRIQVTLKTCRDQEAQVKTILAAAKAQLDALPVQAKTLLDDIAGDAAATNPAYQVMAGERDILLEEMVALSQRIDAKAKALDAIQ